jgi:protein-S-isoprenylcysteine O-methyltransferase Ste14
MKNFIHWTRREYSLPVRLLVTLCAGVLVAFLVPLALIKSLPRLDVLLGFPSLYFGIINLIVGGICVLIGGFYAFWSIGDQLFDAKGSPVPVVATQKLLVTGPFKQCRNPMSFGAFMGYFGISIMVGSISAFLCAGIISVLLISYIKKFEEWELEERFGEEYRAYKISTPFLFPRIFSHPGR